MCIRDRGKTSLLEKLMHDKFDENGVAPTLGLTTHFHDFSVNDKTHKVRLIDSKGFDNNPGIIKIAQYHRFTSFIMVFDVTKRSSFENV